MRSPPRTSSQACQCGHQLPARVSAPARNSSGVACALSFVRNRAFGFPVADEMGNMLQVYRDFEHEVNGLRDTEQTRQLHPGVLSFRQFLAKYKDRIPL